MTTTVDSLVDNTDKILSVGQKVVDAPVDVLIFVLCGILVWLCQKLYKVNKAQAERIGYLREEYIMVSQQAEVSPETIREKLRQFDKKD